MHAHLECPETETGRPGGVVKRGGLHQLGQTLGLFVPGVVIVHLQNGIHACTYIFQNMWRIEICRRSLKIGVPVLRFQNSLLRCRRLTCWPVRVSACVRACVRVSACVRVGACLRVCVRVLHTTLLFGEVRGKHRRATKLLTFDTTSRRQRCKLFFSWGRF